jgi:hypothetical protein
LISRVAPEPATSGRDGTKQNAVLILVFLVDRSWIRDGKKYLPWRPRPVNDVTPATMRVKSA